MAKTKTKNRAQELDSIYFLKMVVYLILGSLWIKINWEYAAQLPIPVGFFIGFALILKDKHQLDRKIGFAILLVAMLIGFWAPFGLYVAL